MRRDCRAERLFPSHVMPEHAGVLSSAQCHVPIDKSSVDYACGPESCFTLGARTTTIRKHPSLTKRRLSTLPLRDRACIVKGRWPITVQAHCVMGTNMDPCQYYMYGTMKIDPRKVNMLQSRLTGDLHTTFDECYSQSADLDR
jgi:hypothetical protein